MTRSRTRSYITYGALAVTSYILFNAFGLTSFNLFPRSSSTGNTREFGIRSTSPDTERLQGLRLTKVAAHAPGFTVFENLYWYNHTYFILTDQPWHIPDPSRLANLHVDSRLPTNGRTAVKIWSIRQGPVSPDIKEENQVGSTISLDEAVEMFSGAEELSSPMFINNDDNFVSHMYHWLGETFLGSWRVWSNYAFRSGLTLPNVKTVAFIRQYHRDEAPPGFNGGQIWEDSPGANKWFTERFFPGVTIESRTTWEARADTNKLFVIPLAVIADRRAGHNGHSSSWKPWGDALRLPVSPDWFTNLRERVLTGYRGPIPLVKTSSKPRILYLERQGSGRELTPEAHEALMASLLELDEEGLADVTIEAFSGKIPFEDQVAKISTVDILVSVHGNGLTHILWMNPGTSVFEIQPAGCTITDYSPLAIAAGVQHYMVHETNFCIPKDCPRRGCQDGATINAYDIKLNPKVITDQIRKIIAGTADVQVDIPST